MSKQREPNTGDWYRAQKGKPGHREKRRERRINAGVTMPCQVIAKSRQEVRCRALWGPAAARACQHPHWSLATRTGNDPGEWHFITVALTHYCTMLQCKHMSLTASLKTNIGISLQVAFWVLPQLSLHFRTVAKSLKFKRK